MVDRNLLREFDVSDDELTAVVTAEDGARRLDHFLGEGQSFEIGSIVSGKIVEVVGDQVVVDVGYKSEGLVPLDEWEDEPPPQPGETVEVLLEGMEDETGEIVLSRKKAHRMRAWEMVISKYHEGDVVKGRSPARSRAACSSISASTSSCPPARSTSAGPPISPITSTRTSSA